MASTDYLLAQDPKNQSSEAYHHNNAAAHLHKRRSALEVEQHATLQQRDDILPHFVPGKVPRAYSDYEREKMRRYESVSTYESQTTVYKDHLEFRGREPRWFIWVFVFLIGCLTAATAALMVSTMHVLFAIRMRLLQFGLSGFSLDSVPAIYDNDEQTGAGSAVFSGQDTHLYGLPSHDFGYGFLMWVLFSGLMAAAASAVCALAPACMGAGTPEVFAYLNGVENTSFDRFGVFVAKIVSTLMTVASGLPLGFYGTLIQCGTMVATFLVGRTKLVRFDNVRIIRCFRNPRDRRIITVLGAAAGIASCFSIAIGGLMVVMENLSTALPVRFALYVFVACLISSMALEIYFSHISYFAIRDRGTMSNGQLISEVLVQFDTKLQSIVPVPMNILDFFPAILLGVLCGYLAILFIRINSISLSLRRMYEKRLESKSLRYVVPVILAMCYSGVTFWFSVAFGGEQGGACAAVPDPIMAVRNVSVISYYGLSGSLCKPYLINGTNQSAPVILPDDLDNVTVPIIAPPILHRYASLSFGFADSTLQYIMSWRTPESIEPGMLALFALFYFLFAAISSGVALVGDVMLPSMVVGGTVGRLVGIAVYRAGRAAGLSDQTWTDPGVFAMIGAGCFLAGTTGLTFSICVILMEVTDDFRHLLPLMVGISIAKRVVERYTHNLTTTYLESRCVPMLDFESRIHKYDMFNAKHVMTSPVVTLDTVSTIDTVLRTLRGCSHHGFPVTSVKDATYKGIILREQLVLVLWHMYLTNSHALCTYEYLQQVDDQLFYDKYEHLVGLDTAYLGGGGKNGAGLDADAPIYSGSLAGGGGGSNNPSFFTRSRGASTSAAGLYSDIDGGYDDEDGAGGRAVRDSSLRETRTGVSGSCHELPPFEDYWLDDRVDLSPYIDQSGFCVLDSTSLSRTYHLFRTLGVRHLVIVNHKNHIVGIVTRKDLIADRILRQVTNENERRRAALGIDGAIGGVDASWDHEWLVADDENNPFGRGYDYGPMHGSAAEFSSQSAIPSQRLNSAREKSTSGVAVVGGEGGAGMMSARSVPESAASATSHPHHHHPPHSRHPRSQSLQEYHPNDDSQNPSATNSSRRHHHHHHPRSILKGSSSLADVTAAAAATTPSSQQQQKQQSNNSGAPTPKNHHHKRQISVSSANAPNQSGTSSNVPSRRKLSSGPLPLPRTTPPAAAAGVPAASMNREEENGKEVQQQEQFPAVPVQEEDLGRYSDPEDYRHSGDDNNSSSSSSCYAAATAGRGPIQRPRHTSNSGVSAATGGGAGVSTTSFTAAYRQRSDGSLPPMKSESYQSSSAADDRQEEDEANSSSEDSIEILRRANLGPTESPRRHGKRISGEGRRARATRLLSGRVENNNNNSFTTAAAMGLRSGSQTPPPAAPLVPSSGHLHSGERTQQGAPAHPPPVISTTSSGGLLLLSSSHHREGDRSNQSSAQEMLTARDGTDEEAASAQVSLAHSLEQQQPQQSVLAVAGAQEQQQQQQPGHAASTTTTAVGPSPQEEESRTPSRRGGQKEGEAKPLLGGSSDSKYSTST